MIPVSDKLTSSLMVRAWQHLTLISKFTREVVYVETPVDTDKDGQLDLVKVTILRPDVDFPVPAMITASPYQQGTNEPASDKLTHKIGGRFARQTSR